MLEGLRKKTEAHVEELAAWTVEREEDLEAAVTESRPRLALAVGVRGRSRGWRRMRRVRRESIDFPQQNLVFLCGAREDQVFVELDAGRARGEGGSVSAWARLKADCQVFCLVRTHQST